MQSFSTEIEGIASGRAELYILLLRFPRSETKSGDCCVIYWLPTGKNELSARRIPNILGIFVWRFWFFAGELARLKNRFLSCAILLTEMDALFSECGN